MKNDLVLLIGETLEMDEIGQEIPVETRREVFCLTKSISRAEWIDAGKIGLKPSFAVTVDFDDYQGEEVVEYDGKRYGVYRTYTKARREIELYLEEKAGI